MVGLLAAPAAGVLSLLGASPAGEGSDILPPSLLPENAPAEADINMLARLMIAEAGGEGREGMQAVGNVIWNRMRSTHPTLGFKNQNTAQSVIKAPNQFEGFENDLYNSADKSPKWQEAKILAAHQLMNNMEDLTEGTVFYRNPSAPGQDNPEAWFQSNYLAGKLQPIKKIGRHMFYRWNDGNGMFVPESLVGVQTPSKKPKVTKKIK